MTEAELNALSRRVLDAAFAVHTELGPGLLESAYQACLVYELRARGIEVVTEVAVPVVYHGVKMADTGFRMDLLVEEHLIVEIKALETLAPVHHAQLLSYLRLGNKRLGLLINFNVDHLRNGIHRKINGYGDPI